MEEEMKEMNQFYEWYDGWALRDMHFFMLREDMDLKTILKMIRISGRKVVNVCVEGLDNAKKISNRKFTIEG